MLIYSENRGFFEDSAGSETRAERISFTLAANIFRCALRRECMAWFVAGMAVALGLGRDVSGGGVADLVNGNPGCGIGGEGVRGGGAVVAEGVDVIDEGEAAVLVAELGDVEDVLGFGEVMVVVAVGEAFAGDVGDPRLVDVGVDLVADGELG